MGKHLNEPSLCQIMHEKIVHVHDNIFLLILHMGNTWPWPRSIVGRLHPNTSYKFRMIKKNNKTTSWRVGLVGT